MVPKILDDLLEVARISRATLELRRNPIEFASTLSAAIETAGPVIDARRHTLTIELRDEPIVLYADEVRLAQILSNLLTNAAKHPIQMATCQYAPDARTDSSSLACATAFHPGARSAYAGLADMRVIVHCTSTFTLFVVTRSYAYHFPLW